MDTALVKYWDSPVLPKPMAQQDYLENRLREIVQQASSDRRDLLVEVKAMADMLYDVRERITRIEVSFKEHEKWAGSQAAKIEELEGHDSDLRSKSRDAQLRMDWWAWLIAGGGATLGLIGRALYDWARGK